MGPFAYESYHRQVTWYSDSDVPFAHLIVSRYHMHRETMFSKVEIRSKAIALGIARTRTSWHQHTVRFETFRYLPFRLRSVASLPLLSMPHCKFFCSAPWFGLFWFGIHHMYLHLYRNRRLPTLKPDASEAFARNLFSSSLQQRQRRDKQTRKIGWEGGEPETQRNRCTSFSPESKFVFCAA